MASRRIAPHRPVSLHYISTRLRHSIGPHVVAEARQRRLAQVWYGDIASRRLAHKPRLGSSASEAARSIAWHRGVSLQYSARSARSGRVMDATSTRYRERLIDEVKRYPVLYDTKHEQHRDIDVRDRCWLEISEKLGASCESLKREWKILRDSMRQAIKRSKQDARTKSGAPCKRWRFQTRMAFVLPYITMRERRGIKHDIKLDESEAPSDGEAPPRDPEPWDPAPGEHDALDLFFASVCQATKRLPRRLQGSVKRQVLDALLRAEDEMDAEGENKLAVKGFQGTDGAASTFPGL